MSLYAMLTDWSRRMFAPETRLRRNYEAFRALLEADGQSHELMAELEMLYHDDRRCDMAGVRIIYDRFSRSVREMIENLVPLKPTDAAELRKYYTKLDFYARFLLSPPEQLIVQPWTQPLSRCRDASLCGNKAVQLAELSAGLQVPVPEGFVLTTNAFHRFVEYNKLRNRLDSLLAGITVNDPDSLRAASRKLQHCVLESAIPPEIEREIDGCFNKLKHEQKNRLLVAVRSSAVNEDGVHSFAGQYLTELAVDSPAGVGHGWRRVLASKYSPEALYYRINLGLADEEASMAVLVLTMVDAAASGVIYTDDPATGGDMTVYAVHGLGETLVAGRVVAETFCLDSGGEKILGHRQGQQDHKLILTDHGVRDVPLESGGQADGCLGDEQVLQLGRWARQIRDRSGSARDIEWALDRDGSLFILQSRPLAQERITSDKEVDCRPVIQAAVLLEGGERASGGIGAGTVVHTGEELSGIREPAVLVTGSTPPSLVSLLGRVSAVVAEQGSTAGHFSTMCREFGVPLLVGTAHARELLKPGMQVTVDGDRRLVYAGIHVQAEEVDRPRNRDDLPWFRHLRPVLDFITPLHLLDPENRSFRPSSCRSLHDIVRYTHETAVRSMFASGEKSGGKSKRQLKTELPLQINLLDVGGSIEEGETGFLVAPEAICSRPFQALWTGLSHPGVDWQSHAHFDWKTFDEVALAGGVAGKQSADLASYAILGREYLNLNMRFGYHFTLVDALCGDDSRLNYCQLRFAGGGGQYEGRRLRLQFLENVLQRLGFTVRLKADLLDGRLAEVEPGALEDVLDQLGRLLGASKLLDMVLNSEQDVEAAVEAFFQGRYHLQS